MGKSTLFINAVSGRRGAKAENRPGVTRGKQWVTVDQGLELLDTPGILWPRFEDPQVGRHLAYTGAVKESVVDQEELAAGLMSLLAERYPAALAERYQLEPRAEMSPGSCWRRRDAAADFWSPAARWTCPGCAARCWRSSAAANSGGLRWSSPAEREENV